MTHTSFATRSLRAPIAAGFLLLTILAGCDATDPADPAVPAAKAGLPDCSGTENLLGNSGFARIEGKGLEPWKGKQHAGKSSFDLAIEEGVVTISRKGPEPWYLLTQILPVTQYQGHRLMFAAELKLDLNDEGWTESMPPGGGLSVLVWGRLPVAMAGDRMVKEHSFEHEPHLGQADWFTATQAIDLPANATKIELGFVHRAMGSYSLRNPRLYDCGPVAGDSAG